MKIIVTGLSGLVGSRFVELLGNEHKLENMSRATGVDITDEEAVYKAVGSSSASVVLHLAAKTNVDGCEEDKVKDEDYIKKKMDFSGLDSAWAINVIGTRNVVDACKKYGKKIVYISTDFVFGGKKKTYVEEDEPNPINWYGKTKFEGEKLVKNSGLDWIIARPAYPYRALFKRNDFVRTIIDRLYRHERLNMITDHIMVPTFIDDLVNALDILIREEQKGIFHVVGSQALTPYEAALAIAREFDLDKSVISKTTREEYFGGKAPRPFRLDLKNAKIGKLGIEMLSFDEGIKEVRSQIESIHI